MELLNEFKDIEAFFAALKTAPYRLLLLDYDGTLAPFKVERDQATPYDGIPELLDEIMTRNSGRVVIISGRAIKDLVPLLGLKRTPEIWGSHGWERLTEAGTYTAFELKNKMQSGLDQAQSWAKDRGLSQRCELKHGCLAIHWRGLGEKEIESIKDDTISNLSPLAQSSELEFRNFDGGIELRAPGMDKGESVKKILSGLDESVVSYLGDDLTDEDAFKALGQNGMSVLVNTNKRPTSADLWLKPPNELIEFLHRWLNSL